MKTTDHLNVHNSSLFFKILMNYNITDRELQENDTLVFENLYASMFLSLYIIFQFI